MQLTVKLPDCLPDVLQVSQEEFEFESKMAMAVKLFQMKCISSGIAGVPPSFLYRHWKTGTGTRRQPRSKPPPGRWTSGHRVAVYSQLVITCYFVKFREVR